MKHIILYISLLFLLSSNYGYGQCLVNGDFEQQFCNSSVHFGTCYTFDAGCVPNWTRSHGTPQIISLQNGKQFYSAYMWARTVNSTLQGEGLFASFDFLAHHAYKITVVAQAHSTDVNIIGGFLLYGANGMIQSPLDGCGDAPPTVASSHLITTTTEYVPANSMWQTPYVISFTPDVDYHQIWIYPTTSSTTQYDLYVDYVNVCPDCDGIITYNVGTVPTGNTKAGFINVGSTAGSGGSGTVNVNSAATTSLQATTTIDFKREFHATISTGKFSAKIIACSDVGSRPSQPNSNNTAHSYNASQSVILPDNVDSNGVVITNYNKFQNKKIITVSPTPTNGKITLTGNQDFRNSKIVINDQSGRIVNQFLNNLRSDMVELDLHYLSNGIYYVKIYMRNEVITKRIVISK